MPFNGTSFDSTWSNQVKICNSSPADRVQIAKFIVHLDHTGKVLLLHVYGGITIGFYPQLSTKLEF